MLMCDRVLPAQRMAIGHTLMPSRLLFEGAATPFIVHGHRHACLYRGSKSSPIPFIVLKICKKLCVPIAQAFAYLRNNEAQSGAFHA
ncbi:hypothetical protein [uncultured Tateyamaria sp.]|uniref:hypothetical protein n=1 Tax=uncultured Tateyamaria sp. TaxID=455651 RepID=UPI00261E4029|nr:hypothetical protein [uncultured Tateyamaria sp.]